jgi:hypothetical protein
VRGEDREDAQQVVANSAAFKFLMWTRARSGGAVATRERIPVTLAILIDLDINIH